MKTPRPTEGAGEARQILDSIRRLVRSLSVYSRDCEARLGLSAAQLFALASVQEQGPLSLKALAATTLTDLSSVSVVVKRLEAKGLVTRKPSDEDRRSIQLSVSPKGAALLRKAPDTLQERLIHALLALPANKRQDLNAQLKQMLRLAGLAGQDASLFFEDKA